MILYTTHCPKCSILEKKLKSKNIDYTAIEDVNIITEKGIDAVPVLEVDGVLMDFTEANKYINKI